MEVEKHTHCMNCGVSIPPRETFCSQKCQMEVEERRRKVLKTQTRL